MDSDPDKVATSKSAKTLSRKVREGVILNSPDLAIVEQKFGIPTASEASRALSPISVPTRDHRSWSAGQLV